MLRNQQRVRLSNQEVEDKAERAKSILDDPIWSDVLNDLYNRALDELMNAEVGSLTASAAHATMKAIITITAQLEEYVADDRMRKKFPKVAPDA